MIIYVWPGAQENLLTATLKDICTSLIEFIQSGSHKNTYAQTHARAHTHTRARWHDTSGLVYFRFSIVIQ